MTDIEARARAYASRMFHRLNYRSGKNGSMGFASIDFVTWAMSDPQYLDLHARWVASGFERSLAPSVRRIDPKLGYFPGNVQIGVRPTTFKTLHPAYRCWRHMMARCHDPKYPRYAHWGGRGIRVCERWHTFSTFAEDMGKRPNGTTLDRIDNNGNYEPRNCRWATPKEQSGNTRKSMMITACGVTQSTVLWSQDTGISARTIRRRIEQGWKPEQAVTKPTGRKREEQKQDE
jgi:hypothetical protein